MEYPKSDLALSQRLERCEAETNVAMTEARARLQPESGATSLLRAGAYALFDGLGSPLTQTFALGLFATPSGEDLDAIEEFFTSRGAEVAHEVSPLASLEMLEILSRRGYRPVELTSVMYRPIGAHAETSTRTNDVATRIIGPGEEELWTRTCAEGWSETPEIADFIQNLASVTTASRGTYAFIAEREGRAVATGALAMHGGIALLAGASTVPAERRHGAQRALLEARLQYAAQHGCDLAMMGAQPGSASQRNAERQGFRIAYTRIKWWKKD